MFFARSPLRFTATNPRFPLGGLYPTSKRDILKHLPAKRLPKTIYLENKQLNKTYIYKKIAEQDILFPLIIKPDNGLRGLGVKIFHTREDFEKDFDTYAEHEKKRGSWLVQEFVNDPLEIGVFYVYDTTTKQGKITGIVQKEFLKITGDGKATFSDLIHAHPRARYHIDLLKEQFDDIWDKVLSVGEEKDIVEIGTHSRGSTFIDISSSVIPELEAVFNDVSSHIPGFYYGRYDVRAPDISGLLSGNFKIIELNPTYGEPTRMYDPSYNFLTQQKILLQHRSMMYTIARKNHEQGVPYATYTERKQAKAEYRQLGV